MSILNEIKHIKNGEKELRRFGWLVGGVLILLGAPHAWRGRAWGLCLSGAGGILVFLGWVRPAGLAALHRLWMTLALLIGAVMTRVILFLVYFGVVTPIGLLARGMRRRFFAEPNRSTHWVERPEDVARERYEKQF